MNLIDTQIISRKYFTDGQKKIEHNWHISELYEQLYDETEWDPYLTKASAVSSCFKWFDSDYYEFQDVKVIKRVNLCHDKFCYNCQSQLADKRQAKFAPILNSYRKDYKICHMILTVPNCTGDELKSVLNNMYLKFPYMMRYFKGLKKIKGVDFAQYNYGGCVRGLEITVNKDTLEYHPHFHCMVLLDKKVDLEEKHLNPYSFKKDGSIVKFSDLAILIQKIWYLLINDIKVTKKSIDELTLGYDCALFDSKGRYHEVFKYACKGAFKKDEGYLIHRYDVFKTLQSALEGRRMIQGYGNLYNIQSDDDDKILEEQATDEYETVVEQLNAVESPVFKAETLEQVLSKTNSSRYISRYNIKKQVSERHRKKNE